MGLRTHQGDFISAPVRRLLKNPDRLNALSLWRVLDEDERAAAARDALERGDLHEQLVGIIAEARNFRAVTVRKWPNARIVEAMQTVPLRDGATAHLLLSTHLENGLREISVDFPGAGVLQEALVDASEEAVRLAADRLVASHGVRLALVCLLTRALVHRTLTAPLRAWWRDFSSVGPADEPVSAGELDDSSTAEIDVPAGSDRTRQLSFTTLDRVLMQAAEDARQSVFGALDEDGIDDAVDELLHLNGSRHRSCFHAGFRDALFGRKLQGQQFAHNASRVRWYWAGAVEGWVRSESWSRITESYDEHPVVRQLGNGEDPASSSAIEHVVRALHQEGRIAELQTFVKERAIVSSRSPIRFCQLLLDIGTESLRAGGAAEARAILELLLRAEDEFHKDGSPPHASLFLQARRRKAHCLRQLGEHLAARDLLLNLLECDPAPNVQAMVHADLGLLEGHFALLADVRLPVAREDLEDIADRLVKGEEHFRTAVKRKVPYAAHGYYCLGVLALAREEYEAAEGFLEQARAHFRSRPKSYPATLIVQADLYLGIARAHSESAEKLSSASTLIVAGLEAGGAPFPRKLLASTVEVLGLGTDASLAEVAAQMLAVGDDDTIDALAGIDALNSCFPLADALLKRASRLNRPADGAAADLRCALRGFLQSGDRNKAERVLDKLEVHAVRGAGVNDFIALLGAPKLYEPAWSREDAAVSRVRCYASRGEFEDAINELRPLFHRYMTEAEIGKANALEDAAGVLDVISGYGLDRAYSEDLERRYHAVTALADDGEAAAPAGQRRRVLVVGGDETHAKAGSRVRNLVAARGENVEITFVYPGWSSNWARFAEKVERAVGEHHAIVIMRFIRTHFGRWIRKECGERNVPWRFCWSGGSGAIAEAVLDAAHAGRAARAR